MGDPRGFLKVKRQTFKRRSIDRRLKDWKELYEAPTIDLLQSQGGRCMDCGVPFCQGGTGCPVQNNIPDFNDLVFRERWRDANKVLHSTNNFPEFTGRLCPAPCESACVLGIIDDPVTIREVEWNIVDRAFDEGWVEPILPNHQTGKKVAIVGSGPAGLAAAQQLCRMGHSVTVYEKDDRIGGLLRYGIPDFKLEKWVIDRRIDQMEKEGVEFIPSVQVGVDLSSRDLLSRYDSICLAGGAMTPRDLPVPGRELEGVHFAMEFLTQQNRINAGNSIPGDQRISAEGRRVVIIGGGDTGSDCLGTSHRQGAKEVHQLELLPQPPPSRDETTPWPLWPMKLRTSHAHEEGGTREWSVLTKKLCGKNGRVSELHAVCVEMRMDKGKMSFSEIPGSEFILEVDLVLLAMGFTGPVRGGLLTDLALEFNPRGALSADEHHMTTTPGIFVAGDMKRGASLIVWAIREGRDAARGIDQFLRAGRSVQS